MRLFLNFYFWIFIFLFVVANQVEASDIKVGAANTGDYLQLLQNRKVGILCNHTSLVDGVHLVDTLLAVGIDVKVVFAPEHGFRGKAGAGEKINDETDERTGIRIVSVYGSKRKPPVEEIKKMDIILFDLQDVGVRFYTYLSSMHYLMESCAQAGVPLLVLDRPNPIGATVDGPILDPSFRSFVGMHPIPVMHGMTLGELALMINGEGWLDKGIKCDLKVVKCRNYAVGDQYVLPVPPSPNLPDMESVYLYPSLCFFEGTPVSIGRGTDFPFVVYGHPGMKGRDFSFTPVSRTEALDPPCKGQVCFGVDLRGSGTMQRVKQGLDMTYILDAYNDLAMGNSFFNQMFEKLMGVDYVRKMVIEGKTAQQIGESWQHDVSRFTNRRKKYLIYERE